MDFPSLEQLTARGTKKWTTYDEDVLPLWVAESDFPTAPAVTDAMRRMVEQETFGYAPGRSGLREALADFSEQRYGFRPEPSRIFWLPDVVRALTLCVQHFTRPGSAVVVPVPSYPPLLEIPEITGRQRVETSLDLDEIEAAFAAGAGSILLANPYNPLGIAFDESYLRKLVELAHAYDVRILADEIHAPLVLDGTHVPVASLDSSHTITATSTSKAFNNAGLKCAQVIFGNDADAQRFKRLNPLLKEGTGTMGIIAAEAAYRHGGAHLDAQLDYLRDTRDWLVEELPRRVPGLKCGKPAATYLLWLDFRDTAIADHPARWLRTHAKLALNEGTTFGPGGEGHARLNFATSREILELALERLSTISKL